MKITAEFIHNHPDLFKFRKSDHIFPHDRFLSWSVLKYLPSSMTPNQLTALRLLLTPGVIMLISMGYYRTGIVLFLITAFTDALDGALARTKNMITKFGTLLDPLADKILIGSLVLLLVFQHFSFWLGVGVLGFEIVFIITAVIAKVKFHTVRAANRWGKIKMMLQVMAVFLTLLALVLQTPYLLTYAAWAFGIAIGFAVVSLFSHGI